MENCGNINSQNMFNNNDYSSNPVGRKQSDQPQRFDTILKPEKTIKISTFNTRTLKDDWHLEE